MSLSGIDRLRPPSPLAGRLASQSLLHALGQGTFLTGSAVFFTQVVGLSAAQVGLGMTVAAAAAFGAAWPMGKVVDRVGPRRCWRVSAAARAGLFAVWPLIGSFGGFVAMAVAMEVVSALGAAAYGAYTIDVLPDEERVESRAFMYSALNVGYTLGSLVAGVALAFDATSLMQALPLFTAVAYAANTIYIGRLPDAPHDQKTSEERRARVPGPGAFRNVGWMLSMFLAGVLWNNQVIISLVIPLWLVEKTDAPHALLAVLFATNTLMCILLPMAASRGVRDISTALRATRLSSALFVASCVVTLLTNDTIGWQTAVLIWVGHIAITGAELYLSAATWAFEAELMDPRRRGEYQGASELSQTLGRVWAPALFTFLAIDRGALGWIVIACIIVLATSALHPAVRRAERFVSHERQAI